MQENESSLLPGPGGNVGTVRDTRVRKASAHVALVAGIASIVLTILFWTLIFSNAVESPLTRFAWGWVILGPVGVVSGLFGRRTTLRRLALVGLWLAVLSIAVSLGIALADLITQIVLGARNS